MVSIAPNDYLRFLQQMHRARGRGRLADLEPVCARLLDEIAIEDEQGTPLTVTGLMALAHIASPATLHRKMQSLMAEALIELQVDPDNKRSKFVGLTKKGKRYYATLAALMADACQAA
jgi:DNA-binding MarR family transcriptional regulator